MKNGILIRKDFSDVDVANTASIKSELKWTLPYLYGVVMQLLPSLLLVL